MSLPARAILAVIALVALATVACAQTPARPASQEGGRAVAGGTGIGVGVRAMGMGGAYTALATDATAIYWNPAGLADVKGLQFAFPVGAKAEGVDVVQETQDLWEAVGDDDIDLGVFETLRDIARREPGRPVWVTTGALAGFAANTIGVGGFGEGAADAVVSYRDFRSTLGYEQVDVTGSSTWYYTYGGGVGRQVSPGVTAGIGVRGVTAGFSTAEYTARYDGVSVTDDSSADTVDDTNFAVDAGVMFRQDENTTLGLMVRNINSPGFTLTSSSMQTSFDMEPCVNVGVAHQTARYTLAADVHNLLDANDAGATLHLGAEWRVGTEIAVRAGLHDGDLAFGLGVALGPVDIQLAVDEGFENMAGIQLGLVF